MKPTVAGNNLNDKFLNLCSCRTPSEILRTKPQNHIPVWNIFFSAYKCSQKQDAKGSRPSAHHPRPNLKSNQLSRSTYPREDNLKSESDTIFWIAQTDTWWKTGGHIQWHYVTTFVLICPSVLQPQTQGTCQQHLSQLHMQGLLHLPISSIANNHDSNCVSLFL